MKYYLSLLVICLFITGCGNQYIDPQQLNLSKYDAVVKELSGRHKLVDSLFFPNDSTQFRNMSLANFHENAIQAFPKTYQLLKETKAESIRYYSESCLIIILKIHSGTFTIKIECLKVKSNASCYAGDKEGKEVDILLKNGMRYQRSNEYVAD